MPPAEPLWYAAYTTARAEKKVACELVKQGIDHYLPLRVTIRQWSDRKKKVEIPLINSYIFVHIIPKEHLTVLQVSGVVKIIHFDGKPVPIPEWQIDNLRILLGANIPHEADCSDLEKGSEVLISQGPLKGLRGHIIQIKGRQKLAISITALDYNLTIDIDPRLVEAVPQDDK
jgi:transcription antitermination factor NusG